MPVPFILLLCAAPPVPPAEEVNVAPRLQYRRKELWEVNEGQTIPHEKPRPLSHLAGAKQFEIRQPARESRRTGIT
jgi:hypothetical protein